MSLVRQPSDEADPAAGPPHRVGSIEGARLYQSIRARLFETDDEPMRVGALRLIRRLGAGGMGEVFLAHDDELDRPVALKLVHARLSHERRFGERMRREARALAKLAHANVVHVYEVGEHEGRIYLAMEYVEGQDLGEWIRESSPSWRAVLDAYLAAGEGLAAAHAAGLTHRDFKPENVLRGHDGRICVADFGLARVDGSRELELTLESGEAAGTLDERLSATGAVMGTPSYMPLEQLRGDRVDARSDQFAFCVALYEGLWGTQPFAGSSVGAREAALIEDRPAVPRRGEVPRWVWPIVRRGLCRDPQQRWPDMHGLLDALRRAPLRQRARRRALVLGLALPLAGLGAWLGLASSHESCIVDDSALIGVWDDARRSNVREAFGRSTRASAGEAAERSIARLDTWTTSWVHERTASCEATWTSGVQSQDMLDRRTLCFDRQLGEFTALVEVLANADDDVIARAGQALDELPDLGACSITALERGNEPAVADSVRAEIDAGYETLARARVELRVGRPEQATMLAERARAVGDALGHQPLVLEARAVLADVTVGSGELAQGLEQLRELVLAAERAQLFELVASLRVRLARVAGGDLAEPRLERWLIDEAQLALDRVARPHDPREVTLQRARARIAEQAGDFTAAIEAHERAYAMAEGRLDEDRRALLRMGVGTALYRNGQLDAARAELERTLAIARELLGPRAPEVGSIAFNLALVVTDLGDFEAAKGYLDSATAIDEAVWGPESIEAARDRFALAYLMFGLGEIVPGCALIDDVLTVYTAKLGELHDETASAITAAATCRYHANDFPAAMTGYQRALKIQQQLLGDEHREIGLLYANIGETHHALGQLDESLAAHEQALAILRAKLPDDHPELATPLMGVASVQLERGDAVSALAGFERALAIADASRTTELAQMRFGLARALLQVQGQRARPRALQLGRQALAEFEQSGIERESARIRAWLAEWE